MSTNHISINISVGDDYQLSDRMRSAIDELGAAFADEHGDDTSGYAAEYEEVAFTYQKIECIWADGVLGRSIVSPRDPASGLPTGKRGN